jgi:Transposase DDE domain
VFEALQGLRFVLRANHDRRVVHEEEPRHLREACELASVVAKRTVDVSPRKAKKQPGAAKRHPDREERVATIAVRGLSVDVREPYARDGKRLPMHVVHAHEVDAPEGAVPIDWLLYTSEPIDTPEHLLRVLDLYRARWVIEEFFKALKSGCDVQSLQLETYEALRNAVALNLPVAWQLLLLRSLGRVQPDAPAEQVLTPTQIQVLRTLGRRPLGPRPTVAQAMIAVACMGGFLVTKAKGPPGWITLGRGMQRLLQYERGWLAALEASRAPKNDPLEH